MKNITIKGTEDYFKEKNSIDFFLPRTSKWDRTPLYFESYSKEDMIFFDIECVGQYPNYKTFCENSNDDTIKSLQNKINYKSNSENISEEYYSNNYKKYATLTPEYGKIVSISILYYKDNEWILININNENEKNILIAFNSIIDKLFATKRGRTKLFGANIIDFDIPYIVKRSIINNVRPSEWLWLFEDKKYDEKNFIDISVIWRLNTKGHDASVSTICNCLNIKTPKDEISGKDVHDVYWGINEKYTKNDIFIYNNKDVICLKDIFEKLQTSLKTYGC